MCEPPRSSSMPCNRSWPLGWGSALASFSLRQKGHLKSLLALGTVLEQAGGKDPKFSANLSQLRDLVRDLHGASPRPESGPAGSPPPQSSPQLEVNAASGKPGVVYGRCSCAMCAIRNVSILFKYCMSRTHITVDSRELG